MRKENILETDRLTVSEFTLADAAFIMKLVNEPAFLAHIGDKGVRDHDSACEYLEKGPMDSYRQHGFGLFRIALKQDDTPIGMCGLIKRPWLADVDVGYAFLKKYRGKGYAFESASTILKYGYETLGIKRIVAITSPENDASIGLLEKLGLQYEKMIESGDGTPPAKLFVPSE